MQKRMADQPPARNIAALVRSAFLQARLGHAPGLKTLLDLGVPPDAIEARSRTARIRTG
jgi:hypothetical protein